MASDPASLRGGLQAATHPMAPYRPRASNIKNSLASLPVRLGLRVLNARVYVFKMHNVRAIMSPQDVHTCSVVHARKTCEHVATVQWQHY
jgi:hypothetical protein